MFTTILGRLVLYVAAEVARQALPVAIHMVIQRRLAKR